MIDADFFNCIGEHAPDAIVIIELPDNSAGEGEGAGEGPGEGARIVWANPAFTALTGYPFDEIAGQPAAILHGPDTKEDDLARIRAALAAGEPITMTLRHYTKARQPFDAEASFVPLPRQDGVPARCLVVQRDVTERLRQERAITARAAALEASRRMLEDDRTRLAGLATVAEHTQELVTITDTEFRILWANPAFAERAGFPGPALRGLRHCDIVAKTGITYSSQQAASRAVIHGTYESGLTRNVTRDGETYWTDVRISLLRDAEGRPERFVVVERDVTAEVRLREEMDRRSDDAARAAATDPLTGVLNRQGFEGAFALACADAEVHGHGIALMLLDLDQLKSVNNTLGHSVGDQILETVAGRLKEFFSADVILGRVGDDEFAVAVTLLDETHDTAAFARRLLEATSRKVPLAGSDLRITLALGYTEWRRAPFDVGRLITQADKALAAAKTKTHPRIQVFDEGLGEQRRRRKTMADELQIAVEHGDFCCHYQPQVDAETASLTGVEALIRWEHPRLGLIPSEDFIPLASELALESRLDRIAMKTALADRARWSAYGLDVPKVSVNVSARRLLKSDLEADLDELDLPPGALAFELLESISLEAADDRIAWALDMLRERGIGIEIDAFGSGHASVSGLLRVAPDWLKIDRSLIAPADIDSTRRRVFELMVETGRTLGVGVIAEGVETEEHVRIARQAGCSVLQGFLYDGPLAPATLLTRYGPARLQSV